MAVTNPVPPLPFKGIHHYRAKKVLLATSLLILLASQLKGACPFSLLSLQTPYHIWNTTSISPLFLPYCQTLILIQVQPVLFP